MPKIKIEDNGFVNIQVWIQPRCNTEYEYYDFKIDTGANRTTINLKTLNSLGYDENWVIENGKQLLGNECPTVATGVVIENCYSICLPEIKIGKYTGVNWQCIVSIDKHIQFRHLFGTDSMQFFNWIFDFENNFCEYNVIENKERVLFNNQYQAVYAIDEIK